MEGLKLNELSMKAILSTEIQHRKTVYRVGPYIKETTYKNPLNKPNKHENQNKITNEY